MWYLQSFLADRTSARGKACAFVRLPCVGGYRRCDLDGFDWSLRVRTRVARPEVVCRGVLIPSPDHVVCCSVRARAGFVQERFRTSATQVGETDMYDANTPLNFDATCLYSLSVACADVRKYAPCAGAETAIYFDVRWTCLSLRHRCAPRRLAQLADIATGREIIDLIIRRTSLSSSTRQWNRCRFRSPFFVNKIGDCASGRTPLAAVEKHILASWSRHRQALERAPKASHLLRPDPIRFGEKHAQPQPPFLLDSPLRRSHCS